LNQQIRQDLNHLIKGTILELIGKTPIERNNGRGVIVTIFFDEIERRLSTEVLEEIK